MDARPDFRSPITPRWGKPVEINALWYYALLTMSDIYKSRDLPAQANDYSAHAARIKETFLAKFWYADGGYLCDTIEGDWWEKGRMRPNQLWAVALGLVEGNEAKLVVDKAIKYLLTTYGLRSLAPMVIVNGQEQPETAYRSHRGADQFKDDNYHQGIVWTWLIGVFVAAALKVYSQDEVIRILDGVQYFKGLRKQLDTTGSIAEIFEGNCTLEHTFNTTGPGSQAWGVAESLRALLLLFPEQAQIIKADRTAGGTGIVYEMCIRDYSRRQEDGKLIPGLQVALKELSVLGEAGVEYLYLESLIEHTGAPFEFIDPQNIDQRAGSVEDFERFVAEAGRCKIKIIVDWIANQHVAKTSPLCREIHPEFFLFTRASDGNVFEEEGRIVLQGKNYQRDDLRKRILHGEEFIAKLRAMNDDQIPQEGSITLLDGAVINFSRADRQLRKKANLGGDHIPVIVKDDAALFLVSATDEISLNVYFPRRWGSLAQADLSHPDLVEYAKETGELWLDKKVGGFRLDAALLPILAALKETGG